MNTKKFPTPNLDLCGVEGSLCDEVDKAVQADIALAVQEETKQLAKHFLDTLNLFGDTQARDAAKGYFESLTVAPMEAPDLVPMQFVETLTKTGENTFAVDSIEPVVPVEKRCGTCAYWDHASTGNIPAFTKLGYCKSGVSGISSEHFGCECPCWKAKP